MIVRKLTTRFQLSNRDVRNKSAEISMRKQVQAAAAVQALSEALRRKKAHPSPYPNRSSPQDTDCVPWIVSATPERTLYGQRLVTGFPEVT